MTDLYVRRAHTPTTLVDGVRQAASQANRIMRQLLVADDSGHLVFSVRLLRDGNGKGMTEGLRFECPTLINCMVGDVWDEVRLDPAQQALLHTPGGRAYAVTGKSSAVFTRSKDGRWIEVEVRTRNFPQLVDVDMILKGPFRDAPESTVRAVHDVFGSGGWWRGAHLITLRVRARAAQE